MALMPPVPAQMEDWWFVASSSVEGAFYAVNHVRRVDMWACSCPFGFRAAERLNAKPCRHVRAVQDEIARKAG